MSKKSTVQPTPVETLSTDDIAAVIAESITDALADELSNVELIKESDELNAAYLSEIEQKVLLILRPETKKVRTKKTENIKLYASTDKQLTESQKLPKQALIILQAIQRRGSSPTTMEQWTADSVHNGLETKQEPIRIVMYYRPLLISTGFVVEAAPETENK